MFQILDAMNQDDIKNDTRLVEVANSIVSVDYTKRGTTVTIGLPGNKLSDIMDGDKLAVFLVLADKEEYFKRKKEEE